MKSSKTMFRVSILLVTLFTVFVAISSYISPVDVVSADSHDIGNKEADHEGGNQGSDHEGGNKEADHEGGNTIRNPLEIDTIDELLVKILGWVRTVALLIILPLALIYAGFLFIKAQGKPEELQKAKRTFLWTLAGAAIIIGAELLVNIISETLTTL